ncbi:hypothetical protein FHR86_003811 [Paenarthrobacter ilicis]|uniref:Uncharacterized protein n=1 Tax=Paenarthrobacter ilicis TaxID=43665 RepID=A0ABX0TS00_9MICC|nr:hypothetical protein [Paenarthrobacter ilicis]
MRVTWPPATSVSPFVIIIQEVVSGTPANHDLGIYVRPRTEKCAISGADSRDNSNLSAPCAHLINGSFDGTRVSCRG